MSRETIIRLIDDLTGKVLEEGQGESIDFAYRGVTYTIDLSNAGAADFDKVMRRYLDAATEVKPTPLPAPAMRRSSGQRADKQVLQDAREWLRANGHNVSDRGRIKGELMDLYLASK